MKSKLLFLVSLGVNLLLVAGMVQHVLKGKPPVAETDADATISKPVKVSLSTEAASVTNVVEVSVVTFQWRQLESEDYHRYAANLRAIGCPETTVQDILYNDVYKAYAAKLRELHRTYRIDRHGKSTDFWKPVKTNHAAMTARTREVMRLNLEKLRLLYALLGLDMESTRRERHGVPDTEAARLAFMSPHQVRQAQEIWERFVELDKATRYKYAGYDGEESVSEQQALHREWEAEMLKVMTAGQLLEYKLRQLPLASGLRDNLEVFEPTELEFRALFQIEKKHDEQYEVPDQSDPLARQKIEAAVARWRADQRQALGEVRFKEYLRSFQTEYRELLQLAQQNNLTKQTVAKAYEMQMEAETQIQRIRDNQDLSSEQRQQATAQLKELALKSVQGVLGERVYQGYQKIGGVRWLESLESPKAP